MVLPLAGPLQPGVLDASATFQSNPILRSLAHANPFAVLFEAYRAVIYGKRRRGPRTCPTSQSLLVLLLASLVLLAFGTLVFKRLEPTFAKVL